MIVVMVTIFVFAFWDNTHNIKQQISLWIKISVGQMHKFTFNKKLFFFFVLISLSNWYETEKELFPRKKIVNMNPDKRQWVSLKA